MGNPKRNRDSDQKPERAGARTGRSSAPLLLFLTLVVIAATLFAHWPVLRAQAVSFDDEEAIIQNHLVQNPSWNSVGRFFGEVTLSSVVRGYYRPLTLTSLMLDWAMGGRPEDFRVFHRTSLALHVGSTILIILLVYQVFHQPMVAALVGLLFGVHPLTVEPIAWVMERKTILAAFFAFACLSAYVRYAALGRSPGKAGVYALARPAWYAGAVILYLLSLLAKPTGTPLPIIMLLMDVWPLKRVGHRAPAAAKPGTTPWPKLVLEKVPFLVLSVVFAALCVLCEEKVNPLSLPAKLSPLHLPLRLCWLVVFYPYKILLPINLSSVYMLPEPLVLTNGLVLLAVAGVVLLAVALVISRRWTPALWVGAAIFYIGLAPTMGFVGYSWVVASDKYVYLPAVGLVLVLGGLLGWIWSHCGPGPQWDDAGIRRRGDAETGGGTRDAGVLVRTIHDSGPAMRRGRLAVVVVPVILASLLATGTRRYLRHWQTSEGLLDYMVALAPDAAQVYLKRGVDRVRKGAFDQAIADYSRVIELRSAYAEAYYNRGNVYSRKGAADQAIQDYTRAIEFKPKYAEAYLNRGVAFAHKGAHDQAIADYGKAIEFMPNCVEAYYNRGNSHRAKRAHDQAVADYTKVIELRPNYAEAYLNRGVAYGEKGADQRAIQDYTKAIELIPNYAEAYINRGAIHAQRGAHDQAIADYSKAIEFRPNYVEAYNNRAVSFCQTKQYDRAWADVRACRQFGRTPHPELIRMLREASGRTE